MNQEQRSNQFHPQVTSESFLANRSPMAADSGTRSGYPLSQGADFDGDDALFARVATMIDLPVNRSEEVTYEAAHEPLKYIQGVIQGQRVYIITNLLEESQVLIQPQMAWTIGRNRDAALPLQDRAMSRRHAVLLYVRGLGFQLIDLNSMNGSFVNGARIQQRHLLKDGDLIRLGSITFTFFVSKRVRTLEPIHPEVLARFSSSQAHASTFIDYLEEPEVLFKAPKSREF